MKRLMFLWALFCLGQQICAMETTRESDQECRITIMEPEFNQRNGKYTIELYDEKNDQIPVGYISYLKDSKEPNLWTLDIFRINSAYRKGGLGLALFKECVSEIKRLGGKAIRWDAQPLDHTIEITTLIEIYKKLVNKSGFGANALTITEPDKPSFAPFVTMKLRLT